LEYLKVDSYDTKSAVFCNGLIRLHTRKNIFLFKENGLAHC